MLNVHKSKNYYSGWNGAAVIDWYVAFQFVYLMVVLVVRRLSMYSENR